MTLTDNDRQRLDAAWDAHVDEHGAPPSTNALRKRARITNTKAQAYVRQRTGPPSKAVDHATALSEALTVATREARAQEVAQAHQVAELTQQLHDAQARIEHLQSQLEAILLAGSVYVQQGTTPASPADRSPAEPPALVPLPPSPAPQNASEGSQRLQSAPEVPQGSQGPQNASEGRSAAVTALLGTITLTRWALDRLRGRL